MRQPLYPSLPQLLLLLHLLGCLLPGARAQTTAITYQGRLNDGPGLANGSYDLQFSLWTAASGPAQAGSPLTTNAVAVTNGVFTVTLDFGNQFSGTDRWLEIAVRTNGAGAFATLTPRQMITSTPYSLFTRGVNAAGIVGQIVDTQLSETNGLPRKFTNPSNQFTGKFTGDAAGLTNLNSTNLVGTVAVARLSTNVALLDQRNAFTGGTNTFTGRVEVLGTVAAAGFVGDGAGLTNLSASLLSGSISSNIIGPGSITSAMLADGSVTASKLATAPAWGAGVLNIANPARGNSDGFGYSVAAVGTDRLLVGSPYDDTRRVDAGAAYLFSLSGTLQATFTNQNAEPLDHFGWSVAAVGNDRVLIGAPYADAGAVDTGAAYLFSTNGSLITTFSNPRLGSSDRFGWTVAAAGSGRVLIGAPYDSTGSGYAGAAYLFSTNGVLITTFTNPAPSFFGNFGHSLASLGNDRVLISAPGDNTGAEYAGATHLFSTNGTLIITFTNPTPAYNDAFGSSVAVLGTDRVLIGTKGDDTGAPDTGAAYLFSTNGTLLTTFTNPAPANLDQFGGSVAVLGTDRVLIGAQFDDTGAMDAGAVYLFNTNGTLIHTFIRPEPSARDFFGVSMAAVGNDRVFIGAYRAETAGTATGGAYLFSTVNYTPGLVAEGVRPLTITSASLADGAVTTATLADGAVTTAKLAANVALLDRRNAFIGGTNTFTGRVGIGTVAPAEDLAIQTTTSDTNASAKISLSANGGRKWIIQSVSGFDTNATGAGSLQFVDVSSTNAALTVSGSGTVGIGTSSPATALHLLTAGDTELSLQSSANNRRWTLQASAGADGVARGGTFQVIDRTAGVSRLLIGTNGNVGIGATTPTEHLSVATTSSDTNATARISLFANGGHKWVIQSVSGFGGGSASVPAGSLELRDVTGGGNVYVSAEVTCTALNLISDRNAKEQFKPVNAREVLDKVVRMSISEWQYKAGDNQTETAARHIGPMAQDFHAAFALGRDDKHIASVDADGVALAAIQGLNEIVREKDAELRRLKSENETLAARLSAIEQALRLQPARPAAKE